MKASYLLFRHVDRGLSHLLAVCVLIALSACEHLPLYNKEKDSLAKSAQETYLGAKVTEAYAVQEDNLKKLLQAEVDALNESAALRLDIALLRMSDDRPQRDGSTSLAAWYKRAVANEESLGFPDSAAVLAMLDHQVEVADAQTVILRLRKRIGSGGDLQAHRTLPACEDVKGKPPTVETWPYLAKSADDFLADDFVEYVKRCQTVVQPPRGAGGSVAEAFNALMRAETELATRRGEAAALVEQVREAAAEVKAAKAEGEAARTAVADATKAVEADIAAAKKAADDLLGAVKDLRELAGGEGAALAAEENIRNISVVLGALGSGQVEAEDVAEDPRLVTAATALKNNVPALAADMAALIDYARAPPVSNLILELQHQTIEHSYATALIRLSELRIELLRARYHRLVNQAGAWRSFRHSLCNYAVLAAGGDHPGIKCDRFAAEPVPLADDVSLTQMVAVCTLEDAPISDCALRQTWRQAHDALRDSRVKREFWSALYYYADVVEAERAAREAELRLVDIEHREVLAAQRSGIEAWSNLVEVPIGQLSAYHASGIQPEALAEAIATILGLTAVGAGVAQ
jgi:hypothetical protein